MSILVASPSEASREGPEDGDGPALRATKIVTSASLGSRRKVTPGKSEMSKSRNVSALVPASARALKGRHRLINPFDSGRGLSRCGGRAPSPPPEDAGTGASFSVGSLES